MSKVESIFGVSGRGKFGCGFLSRRDLDDLLSGELDESRSERFDEHRRACDECVHLLVAVERFRAVFDGGVLQAEARQYAAGEPRVQARLREAFERAFRATGQPRVSLPWSREMSTDELERIAAAGPEGPTDPGMPEEDGDR